jgi:hypothetical protein
MATTTVRATLDMLQLPYLEAFIGQEIVTVSDLYDFLSMKQVNKIQHEYNKELTLGDANYVLPILPSGTWTASAGTFTNVTDTLKLFGASAYVPLMGLNDPAVYEAQLSPKVKVVGNSIARLLISGSGTDPEWKGLLQQVSGSSTQEIAAAACGSGSLSLPKMDSMISAVKSGPVSFILMSTTDRDSLLTLIRGSYSQPNFITSANFGQPILTYQGIPIIRSDYIAGDTVDTTASTRRVYAVHSAPIGGTTLWFNNATDLISIREVPVGQSNLTEIQVTAQVGFSIQSSLSVACIKGVY